MERYIDKLRQAVTVENQFETTAKKETDKRAPTNPSVVCSVTLGKNLHAGHLFLLATGQQIQGALDSKYPLFLLNNNTGPRAAGALIEVASQQQMSLTDAAAFMDQGGLEPQTIVDAYRARKESSPAIDEAMNILTTSGCDIFARIAVETEELLNSSGFNVQVVSEAKLLQLGTLMADSLNPVWSGTGFIPFQDERRTVVLQKSGGLTATGTCMSSMAALAEGIQSDLIVAVDSSPDTLDATYVYSKVNDSSAIQMPGAGAGIEGKIASGTGGEALTIAEIAKNYYKERPQGNLMQAALFLTLTRPLSFPQGSLNLADSFYDFKNSESMVNLLITTGDEALIYKQSVTNMLQTMKNNLSDSPVTSSKDAQKLLEFLPQKYQALVHSDTAKVLSISKKLDPVTALEQIKIHSAEIGYDSDKTNPYVTGKRTLAVRKNYYFSYLTNLVKSLQDIQALTGQQYAMISQMVNICMEKVSI